MPQKYHSDFIPDDENDKSQFTTRLSSDEEKKFQEWVKTNKIPGANESNFGNYDMRGFWKENPNFQHKEGEHFTDKFKQPGHETFSVESKYAKGRSDAGRWEGDTFIPSTKKSNKYHSDFIPDNSEEIEETDNEPSTFSRLASGVSDWIKSHPSIDRAIHGPTGNQSEKAKKAENPHYPFRDASHTQLASNYLESPERGIVSYKGKDIGTAFDELRNRNADIYAGHPWKSVAASLATEPSRFLTELANDPFVLASGGPGRLFSKAGGLFGDLKAARARVPQVSDLGNVAPEGQKLLGAGPRFQVEPIEGEIVPDVADTTAGQSLPIRRSREIPYRPTTDVVSGDISPVRNESFPYRTPEPEVPTGQLLRSFSTAYGDTPRAIEARRRFAEKSTPRQAIEDASRLLPEGVRQPKSEDLLINEEGRLPGEMSLSEALFYEPEFKPWRGLRDLSKRILGRDILERNVESGRDPFRGPIDWGPIASGNTDETALTASRPMGEKKPTARYRAWQQTGLDDIPDFPLYDVEGGPSHGTTTDVEGLKKLGIDVPETAPNPHHPDFIPDEPQFAKIMKFPNKGNVPERLQAAKFVAQIADDRYNDALAKFNSGRIRKEELDVIKADRDKALAEHSRLVEQSKGIESQKTEKPPEDEGPSFARSEQGGIKIGQNIRRSANEVTTGYDKPLQAIMVREGLQNAIDATRHLGADGKIKITTRDDGFTITDNGKGMTREELETVFSDLYESGKGGEEGATGGKGIGKASYMLGGNHFKVETISFQNGKKIKITAEGTPQEFESHVPVHEEIVPLQTPTGTTISTKFKKDQEIIHANVMLGRIMDSTRNVKQKIIIDKYGAESPPQSFKSTKDEKVIHKSNIDGNDIVISTPKDDFDLKTRRYIEVNYLNNGMYQFSKTHYFDKETSMMPKNITVDIHPTAEEGTPGYPFPTQRESIKDTIDQQIDKLIDETLAKPQQQARQSKLRELYQSMAEVTTGTKRKAVIYDPGNRLTANELEHIRSSPTINNIVKHYDDFIHNVLERIGNNKWSERLEGVGIVLDPNMHGVHIPNPDTGKSTILMNPFIRINDSSPEDASLGTIITGLHEIAHIGTGEGKAGVQLASEDLNDPRVGKYLQEYLQQVETHGGSDIGHSIDFVKRLAEVFSKAGVADTFGAADEFKTIITDESGNLNPETEKLLQIYSKSRGRSETTEDFLSPTGEQSKSGQSGKGRPTSSNRPNGEGTLESAVNKLFSALTEAKSSAAEQAQNLKVERARRFAAFEGVKGEGVEGAKKSMGKLRGEYEKSELPDALKMSKEETNQLFTAVKRANITTGEKARGYTALFKLMEGGEPPVRSELAVLDSVFGNGFAGKIMELHGGLGGVKIKIGKAANTMKALMGSIDVSAPMRQGIGLIHKPEWRDAFVEMFKYFGNKEYYEAAMQHLENRPTYLLGREAGLFLNKPGSLLSSEELFLNSYIPELSKIPVVGRVLKAGVGASERAYSGFLNKLRADVFDTLIKEARVAGHEAFTIAEQETEDGVKKIIVPSKTTENISKFINNASGRGSLGKLEKVAPELNTIIWSPRLISSRLTVLNPTYYYKMDAFTRKEAIKSLFAIAATGAIVSSLASVIGGKSLGNPLSSNMNWFGGRRPQILSSDFGKVRMPSNNVLDPWGGFQQPIVAAARFMAGRTEIGPQQRSVTAENFAVSKLSPIASLAYEIASAKKWTGGGEFQTRFGQPSSIQTEIGKRFVPIFIQDFNDLVRSDSSFAEKVGMSGAAAVGMGVQDYPERTGNKPRRMTLRP